MNFDETTTQCNIILSFYSLQSREKCYLIEFQSIIINIIIIIIIIFIISS